MPLGGIPRTPPTLETLDELSRTRPLTKLEVLQLERAVRRHFHEEVQRHWTRADDYRMIRYLMRGRRPKQIGVLMNRTERSIWRRMTRMGITVKMIETVVAVVAGPGSGKQPRENSSIAPDGEK